MLSKKIFKYQRMITIKYDLTSNRAHKLSFNIGNIEIRRLNLLSETDKEKFIQVLSEMDFTPPFDIDEVETRLNKGFLLIIAETAEKEIVGWSWAAFKEVYFNDFFYTITLNSDEAFIYNTYVSKEHRGQKINHLLLTRLLCEIRKKNINKAWALIHHWNKSSIRSYLKYGFKNIGDYYFLRMGPFVFSYRPKAF